MAEDVVFLTGGSGFIGGHVLDELLAAGITVRALARSPGDVAGSVDDEHRRAWPELGSDRRVKRQTAARDSRLLEVIGDVRSAGRLVPALEGCSAVVHVAGAYSFSPRDRRDLHAINVGGTASILEAARIAGVPRAVVTSSSSTVGPARAHGPATAADWAPAHRHSAYHTSKIAAERAALAARVPVTAILPTAPVGAGDARPTPTGAMIVDFLRGRMVGVLDGGLNIVDVEDVARAHVHALRAGSPRRRHLVGGENLTLAELWLRLAGICGRRAAVRRIPYALAIAAGHADEMRVRAFGGRPAVPLEGVRMGRLLMHVDDEADRTELGLGPPSPIDGALERAVRWYRDHGMAP